MPDQNLVVKVYAIKGKGTKAKFYRLPVGDAKAQRHFTPILQKGQEDIHRSEQNNKIVNYSKIVDMSLDEHEHARYFAVEAENISDSVAESLARPLLHTQPDLAAYIPRANSKNTFPFTSFLITSQKYDGTYEAGVIMLKPALKISAGTHLIFRIWEGRYRFLDDSASNILIPKKLSIVVKGKVENRVVKINKLYIKKKDRALFEDLFVYHEFWVSEAVKNRASCTNYLTINDAAWNTYTKRNTRTRKLAIVLREGLNQDRVTIIENYKNDPRLAGKLQFTIDASSGHKKVLVNTVEGLKQFIDCYQEKILELPRTSEWYRVPSKTHM